MTLPRGFPEGVRAPVGLALGSLFDAQPQFLDHLFAHHEFLDLAGHRHRERVDKFDVARDETL
jgi:hypothetical protein